jgi:hypothetical protein
VRVTPARLFRNAAAATIVVFVNVVLIAYVVSAMTDSPLAGGLLASASPARRALPPTSTPTTLPITSTTARSDGQPAAVAPVTTQPPHLSAPTTSVPRPSTTVAPARRSPAPPSTSAPTTAPVQPAQTTTPAPAPAQAPGEGLHAVVDVGDPMADIAPDPDFLGDCGSASYDDSSRCADAVLTAIDNARADEGLGAMVLPANWTSLSAAQQLFVATNLERTARGLPPVAAMVGALDVEAARSVLSGTDPVPPLGFAAQWWTGNWAGALGNPLEALYYWMYDDGLGSPNVACTTTNQSGCWGHRQNVLVQQRCTPCVAGAAWGTTTGGTTSTTEMIVGTQGSPPVDFTWQQEVASLG